MRLFEMEGNEDEGNEKREDDDEICKTKPFVSGSVEREITTW